MRRREKPAPKLDDGRRKKDEKRPASAASLASSFILHPSSLLISLLLLFLGLVAFGGLCSADSVFCNMDDPRYVSENPHVQVGLTAGSVRWAFTSFEASNWHPLTWLSLQLDRDLFGPDAWGYHLTNLLLHAANAILLFLWLRYVTTAVWRSAFVAVLFLIHPLHVQSVAWVTERKDVLSTFFWMLTLWAYAYYAERPALGRYSMVVLSLAFGLMAKPMLVTLPCVLLLLDWWPLQRGNPGPEIRNPKSETRNKFEIRTRESKTKPAISFVWNLGFQISSLFRISDFGFRILEKLPLLAISLAASVVTVLAQESVLQPLEKLPLSARLANAAISYWRYVGKTFWPSDLSFMYLYPPQGWPWWAGAAAIAGLVAVTALVLTRAGRQRRYLAVGWLWFLGTLAPVIGVVQVGMQAIADRYTYVPLIGLFIIIVWGVAELSPADNRQQATGDRERARSPIAYYLLPVACCLGTLALLLVTWQQVALWQDLRALWVNVVEIEPNYRPAYLFAGEMVLRNGKPEEAVNYLQKAAEYMPNSSYVRYQLGVGLCQLQRWDEAIHHLEVAAPLGPKDAPIHTLLGHCYMAELRASEAARQFEIAVESAPDSAEAHSQLGAALLYQGKQDESRRQLNEALRLDPASSFPHTQLGLLYLLEGNHEQGQAQLRQSLAAAPSDVAANFYLGWSLQAIGQSDGAKVQYERVRQSAPQWPQTAAKLAWSLATQPDAANRNGPLALLHAEAACQAAAAPEVELLDALAAAQAETGRYTDAAATLRQALAQTPAESSKRAELERRLALYTSGQPFRAGK